MSEAKYRITDLAKEFKTDKGTIIDILKSKNYKVKNMFSAVGEEERAAVKAELGRTAKPVRKEGSSETCGTEDDCAQEACGEG